MHTTGRWRADTTCGSRMKCVRMPSERVRGLAAAGVTFLAISTVLILVYNASVRLGVPIVMAVELRASGSQRLG